MFFETGSVFRRKSELSLTTVRKSKVKFQYISLFSGIFILIVDLTPLIDAIIVLDRSYSRHLTAYYAWFN